MKLLIVDDEPHIRHMMRLTLERGHHIEEAANGDEALSRDRDDQSRGGVAGRTADATPSGTGRRILESHQP